MADVAMFPLGSVLFPHTPLALRLFEERYLIMLGRLLDDDEPEFGVVLIERGHEAGGGDQRFVIGTVARITQVVPREHDIQLVAYGARRIEVVNWLEDDPHPAATVREVPELVWDEALAPLRAEAERHVRRVLARAAEFAEVQWNADVELSDDPVESSWQLAAISPLGSIDQYTLLRSTSTAQLLGTLIDLTLEAEPALTSASADGFDDALEELLGGKDEDNTDEGGSELRS